MTIALTEIEFVHRLGCKTISDARRVLRKYPAAAVLPSGPRWTETQVRAILGEAATPADDDAAEEARLLARLSHAQA